MHLRARMLRVNPGWEVRLWTDREIDAMGLYNRKEYLSVKGLSFKSDIVRYEIMARYGGVYCDFDLIWLRPLEELVDLSRDFVARENHRGTINNGIYGVCRSSPFAWDLVGDLPESYLREEGLGGRVDQSGVGFFARTFAKHQGHVVRLPWNAFHPYSVAQFQAADLSGHPTATAIHTFMSNGLEGKIRSLIERGLV